MNNYLNMGDTIMCFCRTPLRGAQQPQRHPAFLFPSPHRTPRRPPAPSGILVIVSPQSLGDPSKCPHVRKFQSEALSLSHCRGLLWVAQGNTEKGGIQFGGEEEEQGWGVSEDCAG